MVDMLTAIHKSPYSSRISPSTYVSTLTILVDTEVVDSMLSYVNHYVLWSVNLYFCQLVNLRQLLRWTVYIFIIIKKKDTCQPKYLFIPPPIGKEYAMSSKSWHRTTSIVPNPDVVAVFYDSDNDEIYISPTVLLIVEEWETEFCHWDEDAYQERDQYPTPAVLWRDGIIDSTVGIESGCLGFWSLSLEGKPTREMESVVAMIKDFNEYNDKMKKRGK